MKNIFILFSVLLFSSRIQGQINFCASNEIHNQKMIIDSNYQQKYLQAHTIMQQANNNNALMVGDVYYLPVIVHVIHTGDPLGTGSNPSDLQIQNYISVLNQAFSASFPTYPDTNNGGQNIKIQFQLAQRDLNCNATNGINRINASNNANYVSDDVKWNWNDPGISHNDLATIAFWDNTQYINLWLVNNIYGWTAGYAYYPVAGYSFGDGIVIESGDVYSNNPDLVAHEFGHAFDLRHTHEGSSGAICPPNNICLNEGDYVCDTDPTLENINNFGCSAANINPCTNASYGNIIYNYMNYYCYHTMFTLGQKQRMINALLNLKSSLISSLGAQAPSPITPTISIVESFNNVGSGTSVTYTASITNGGTPSYQWKVNGNNVGTNTNTYSYTPNNTDIVTCQLTSTATCANPTIVNSNSINMFVTNIVTPTISIVESANNICSGTSVSYTASITNGGTPTYQWKVNGTNVGTNTNTYSYIPNNTDIVTCQLTSTATCANPTIVNSNSINMIVSNVVSPTISIVESANNICLGTMVTYTATITNGGTPTYQWKVNGNNVGTNSNIYSYIPNNTDIVTCQLTSTAACINPIIVTSNSINMIVFNAVTPTISIVESANNICQGTSVTYTASITNGGTPSYQWIVNGTNVGTNSNTYTYIPNNVDIVACQLTSTATCANPIIVTSNSINMYVTNAVT
ncbi:MAG: hypothetical protein IPG85_16980 [Bacteroidetes bacterium]|nr:hypothetical protein [Bacteroidota bacterium]